MIKLINKYLPIINFIAIVILLISINIIQNKEKETGCIKELQSCIPTR